MSQDIEQAFAEYLGNSFIPFAGWEEQASGGGQTELAKYSSELRAKAKGYTLRRIKEARKEAREARLKAFLNAPAKAVGPIPSTQLAKIAHFVSCATGVKVMVLRSPRRSVEYVRARHMFFWLAREFTPLSFPAIGAWCGSRDHSTVQHGAKKVAANIADYPELEKIKLLLGVGE